MRCTGFVLAGGQSTRMGRDKALLPFDDGLLLDHQVQLLSQVTDCVRVIGAPHGMPDKWPGIGPLGGILTALDVTDTAWNLIVGCDLPALTLPVFRRILQEAALQPDIDCLIPRADAQEHPLCGAYNRSAFAGLLRSENHSVRAAIRLTRHEFLDFEDSSPFRNVNTPQDWAAFLETTHAS